MAPKATPRDRHVFPIVLDLQRATHAVGLRIEAELEDIGVSQGEAHVLALLAGGNPLTVGELQRGLHHRPSTLSGILDRLEKRGYLTRRLNQADRRSLLVTLTRSGRRVADRVAGAMQAIEREATAAAGPGSVAGFRAVARALYAGPDN
jgi:MarR family transcriptional regulator, organic hydroperoxide resistance regulator